MHFVVSLLLLLAAHLPAATIDTIAGTGKPGHAGDGGKATEALIRDPFHCDLDGKGGLYIAEAAGQCIRKVDLKTGLISTVAGIGAKGYSGDGGPATKATFNEPYAVAVAEDGALYVADRLNAVVRKIDPAGVISTVAGNGKKGFAGDGGKATEAQLVEPNDVCLDGKGGLLIADVADWRVRRLDLKTGIISTFAGSGRIRALLGKENVGDGGPADKAVLAGARAVCVDGKGNIYICEREGNCIRRVDDKGVVTTLAGTREAGAKDGAADKVSFRGPKGVRCDREGNVYVVDTENHAIRKVDVKTKEVSTLAGGRKGSGGDGGDARAAEMDRPHGCVVGRDGVVYIADTNNHRVRRVQPK
jgi:streptogramin lyase